MNPKKLIQHSSDLLLTYVLARMGISINHVKNNLFEIIDKNKRDLRQPIIIPEEEVLEKYLLDYKVDYDFNLLI